MVLEAGATGELSPIRCDQSERTEHAMILAFARFMAHDLSLNPSKLHSHRASWSLNRAQGQAGINRSRIALHCIIVN